MSASEKLKGDLLAAIPSLRAFAVSLSGNPDRADDLVQETLLRALANIESFQPGTNMSAWLFTILRRENARLYEKHQPELDDIDEHETTLPDAGHLEPDQQMEALLLHKAILALEPEYREPLALQVIGGFSGDQIRVVDISGTGEVSSMATWPQQQPLR